jgi:hypothetical protein
MMNENETEAEMIEREIASLSPKDKERARIGIVRWRADLLNFPHLCPKGSCRRTRKCSGNPDICTNLLAPFVPETVHDAVAIMFDAQSDRLTYDEVRAKAPLEMQAYEEWLGKIRDSKEATAPFLRRKSRGAGSQSHEP